MSIFSGSQGDVNFGLFLLTGTFTFLPSFFIWPVIFQGLRHHHKLGLGFVLLAGTFLVTTAAAYLCIQSNVIIFVPGVVFFAATIAIGEQCWEKYKVQPEEVLHISIKYEPTPPSRRPRSL